MSILCALNEASGGAGDLYVVAGTWITLPVPGVDHRGGLQQKASSRRRDASPVESCELQRGGGRRPLLDGRMLALAGCRFATRLAITTPIVDGADGL